MKALLAAAALTAGIVASSGADALEGTFISFDDEQMMNAGIIVPVFEYIEIGPDEQGGQMIEVGYLHPVVQAENMPTWLWTPESSAEGGSAPLGVLEPAEGRRVTLRGPVSRREGALSWTAELYAPSSHEPGRFIARESPFLAATGGPGADGSVKVNLFGSMLLVVAPDGAVHRYRRMDLNLVRMTGLLAFINTVSYVQNHACMTPLAEALVAGTPYRFSDDVLAMPPDALELSAETLDEMRNRGLGRLLLRFIAATQQANEAAGRLIEAELAGYDSVEDYVAATEGMRAISDPDRSLRLLAVTRLHILEAADLDTPFEFDQSAIREWITARYEEDPWSVTTPFVLAVTPDNWVSGIQQLLRHEIEHLCPHP